jgi:hypothetical protein
VPDVIRIPLHLVLSARLEAGDGAPPRIVIETPTTTVELVHDPSRLPVQDAAAADDTAVRVAGILAELLLDHASIIQRAVT